MMMCTSPSHLERLLIGTMVLIMAGAASAQPLDGPIHIEADQGQVSQRMEKSVYSGHVVISQGPITLRGDKLIVKRIDNGDIRAVVSGNPAHLQRQTSQDKTLSGHAQRLIYNSARDTIKLSGDAFLKRAGNTLSSDTIRYNLATTKTTASSESKGRVSITLNPGGLDSSNDQPKQDQTDNQTSHGH